MAIVVGDIHGNVEKAQAFLNYKPDEEHVAVGDYLDSHCEPQERQIKALQLLLDSQAVLLWGNHDLHYLVPPPFKCSGFQYHRETALQEIIEANKRRFLTAYIADGWLCSHAGCASKLTQGQTADQISARLNEGMQLWLDRGKTNPMFGIGHARDGAAAIGGCFWLDYRMEFLWLDETVKQIFGHTAVKEPAVTKTHVALDTTGDKERVFLFDTVATDLVLLPLLGRRQRCKECLMLTDYLNDDDTCTDCGRRP